MFSIGGTFGFNCKLSTPDGPLGRSRSRRRRFLSRLGWSKGRAYHQHPSFLHNSTLTAASDSSFSARQELSAQPLNTFHDFHDTNDSGYFSSRPASSSSVSKTVHKCPSIPQFSWQIPEPDEPLPIPPARAANFISWTDQVDLLIERSFNNPRISFFASGSRSPSPLPINCVEMSTQSPEKRREQEASSSSSMTESRPRIQTTLHLRDPSTSTFPSLNNDPASPTKSETSDDDSPQVAPDASVSAPKVTASLPATQSSTGGPVGSSSSLSGLVCNVHRTTGREPPGLVGASTTVVGDKLYVFGGRRLRPQRLTKDLYELDLVHRNWVKLEMKGDVPSPRFFHSMCALGDTKLVCYGGMALSRKTPEQQQSTSAPQVVTSDIHFYDIATQTWTAIQTTESPPRRYAHCATILPSSAVFSSASAPLSAVHHNPASSNPNQGSLGVSIDGRGGAHMIVVGGQDGQSNFIDSVEVFNLRSLKWMKSTPLEKSCGAYRSVVAPLIGTSPSKIGSQRPGEKSSLELEQDNAKDEDRGDEDETVSGSPMLVFSNYNFLDVQLDLQVRLAGGKIVEKPLKGKYKPPGLRFPNGGVINNHFIISGTSITSTRQEYMLWALDLKSLVWSRVDVGSGIFSSGSWNRGVLWNKRNAFVILGSRKRSIAEDYEKRRLNFSNLCTVELEAFGLYDNPRRHIPSCGYPFLIPLVPSEDPDPSVRARADLHATEELGSAAMGLKGVADMDILAIGGERIPVNSHFIRRRWGPYFQQLLREDSARADNGSDTATLQPGVIGDSSRNRNSIITITPSTHTAGSSATTAVGSENTPRTESIASEATAVSQRTAFAHSPAASRSRLLYLPHTYLTIRALVHYLYTSSLPPLSSPFCTPQILCSLLQIARPYHVDGLLEATIERLHQVLDSRNTAAVFNAAAMAAGGGDSVRFVGDRLPRGLVSTRDWATGESQLPATAEPINREASASRQTVIEDDSDVDGMSSASTSTTDISDVEVTTKKGEKDISTWGGELSAVVGLQKRGLRGLIESRKRGKSDASISESFVNGNPASASADASAGGSVAGLGIG